MPRARMYTAGEQIVTKLEDTFTKYLALDPGLPLVLALWALATHLFDCFDAFPYLAITSPTKRCGKTRLAELIEPLCCNGLRTVGATPAAIFRTIQAHDTQGRTVVLIMDESEVLRSHSERAEALREILNAGYRRGQSVLRCERTSNEGSFEPKGFNVYCPKVIVLIGDLHDTLADRCIPVAMRRRKTSENVARLIYSRAMKEFKRLRKESEIWAKTSRRQVKRHYAQDLEFLEDREAELWAPLFSICASAAPEKQNDLKATALRISGAKQADEPNDYGILLLKDIRAIFDAREWDRFPTIDLFCALNLIEESPWARWSRGSGLDARGLARLLRPFNVCSRNMRFPDDRVVKGYARVDFEETWATYLPPDSAATTLQEA